MTQQTYNVIYLKIQSITMFLTLAQNVNLQGTIKSHLLARKVNSTHAQALDVHANDSNEERSVVTVTVYNPLCIQA